MADEDELKPKGAESNEGSKGSKGADKKKKKKKNKDKDKDKDKDRGLQTSKESTEDTEDSKSEKEDKKKRKGKGDSYDVLKAVDLGKLQSFLGDLKAAIKKDPKRDEKYKHIDWLMKNNAKNYSNNREEAAKHMIGAMGGVDVSRELVKDCLKKQLNEMKIISKSEHQKLSKELDVDNAEVKFVPFEKYVSELKKCVKVNDDGSFELK